ncbi:hypothetical protein ACBJ59_39580 [Nonomuraea sp. MTCD27]|uniref:hypothetical protein n=1 Tax=Nonomuraea sp. MTCD27 TaxID=1676747 RepID=UPI0035C13F57
MGVPIKAMVAVALFELALRGRGRRIAYGAGVSAFFLTLHAMSAPAAEVAPTLYRLSILLGVPLLSGAYVRLTRENARQARDRADAEEPRRRADTSNREIAERLYLGVSTVKTYVASLMRKTARPTGSGWPCRRHRAQASITSRRTSGLLVMMPSTR